MAKANTFMDRLNRGGAKTAVATCASRAFIIDEFPPHLRQGPAACAYWASAWPAPDDVHGLEEGAADKPLG